MNAENETNKSTEMMTTTDVNTSVVEKINNTDANKPCNDTFNITDYLASIKLADKSIDWSKDQLKALAQSDVTLTHKKRGNKLERSFLQGLELIQDKNGNQKWAEMLRPIFNENWQITGGEKEIPRAFVVIGGEINIAKIRLCNAMVVDWQINLQKKISSLQKSVLFTNRILKILS